MVALSLVLLAMVVGVLLVASRRPDSFRIERSIAIAAPPETVFALLNDFKHWAQWSPWEKIDPTMQRTHSGADHGVGAVYSWTGTGKAGAGRMEILKSQGAASLVIQLDFFKPFKAHNTAEFTLRAEGGATNVVWAMYGPSPLVSKVMGLFFNLDRLVGKDFETGLKNLQALAAAR